MTAVIEKPAADTVLVQVDPGTLVVGANVRNDTHPDAKEFAASIKARGVLEVITAYRDDQDRLVVLRGQRRTLVATEVGTPTVPVQVVPAPDDADRVTDQLAENLHRAPMREREVRDGIEQLALCGVSAALIAKRTALKRTTVDAALRVSRNPSTRERMDTHDMTLEDAAIFADFEDDQDAVDALTEAHRMGRSLPHIAQRLHDEAEETAARAAEVARLREAGVTVLDPDQVPTPLWRHRLSDLLTQEGEAVPESDWPAVPGAAVVVTTDWRYPTNGHGTDEDGTDKDGTDDEADAVAYEDDEEDCGVGGEPVRVFVPVWVCTDPAAANLHSRYDSGRSTGTGQAGGGRDEEAQREARAAERRLVIANNKAWRSAEVVRREWLSGFLGRKTPPAGAEAVVCEAVVTSQWTLTKAMESRHSMLRDLLGTDAAPGDVQDLCQRLAVRPSTPKASTMLSLACVVAAWEQSTGTHTWRNPSDWDRRVMSALAGWGYPPSEVESLLTRTDSTQLESSSGTEPDAEQERSEGAEVSAPHPGVVSEA